VLSLVGVGAYYELVISPGLPSSSVQWHLGNTTQLAG